MPLDDLADLAVNQRLAARNRHHGRAAFIDGVETFLDREPAIENRIGIVDLAASEAGEIAAKQRLQHQHERIAFAPQQLLLENIGADANFLEERNLHSVLPVERLRQPPIRGSTASRICSRRAGKVEISPGR